MATHEMSILGSNTKPDASGLVWQEPYAIDATNDNWNHLTYVFETPGSTQNKLYGTFVIPQNYVGTPTINVYWSCSGTTANDVEWDFEYRAIAAGESMDQATAIEQLNQNDTDSATANLLMVATLTPTQTLAASDIVEFFLARDGSDAGDTLNDKITLHAVTFKYADA